ncbi:GGDEF domain-containing protein [Ideonella sp. A 288]|uniref:GGDEF domain-containing protein n=1 Tax=Ideonella sp. A 288 TaxID=1962181 RepID=UPI000B4BA957|nr:GGDEF domain-containing protein [Ideonella sp. A 288]
MSATILATTALDTARLARTQGDLPAGLAAALQALTQETGAAERAEAGHLACFFHYRLGQLDAMLALGRTVAGQLETLGRIEERVELLRWMAIGGAETGRFDLALQSADQAYRLAQLQDDAGQRAMALNALAACFERMGDPWQGERLMVDALAQAEADGGVYPRMVTLNNLCGLTIGAYHMLRGVADDEARAALERAHGYAERALALAQPAGEPFFLVFVHGNLGEVLLHLGLLDEAGRLLDQALRDAIDKGFTAQAWRIRCTKAEEHLARGRPAEARALLLELIAEGGTQVPQATALRLHHGLYLACRTLELPIEALQHFERYEHLLRQRAASQLRAQSELLVTRLEVERAHFEAQTERARAAEMARHANHDALTGLGNRRHVESHLPALLARAHERQQSLALVVVDIDHFKLTNDRHGHLCGDRVLVMLAQMLRENTRAADLLARIGGEEFLIVLPDTEFARAIEVCERLRERVAGHDWDTLSPGLSVTVSVGLAQTPPYDQDGLFELADRALYRAKQAGRNRVRA